MAAQNTDATIQNGYKSEFCSALDTNTTLLVPHGVHPSRLSPLVTDPYIWYQKYGLPVDASDAWDVVWQKGMGRGPWQGGTLDGYEWSYAMGIRYEELRIGESGYWVPRAACDEELDSAAEWEMIAETKWAYLWEHIYFGNLGLAGRIPEGYGEDRLGRAWKEMCGTESNDEESDEETEEPRELSPAEPGRMEERGFMTWASPGITVGDS